MPDHIRGTVAHRAEDAVALVEQTMLGLGRAGAGDKVVILAGCPGQAGTTNTIRVHELST